VLTISVNKITKARPKEKVEKISIKRTVPEINNAYLFHFLGFLDRIDGRPALFLADLASNIASAMSHTSSISKALDLLISPLTINMAKQSLKSCSFMLTP
jgi:hypothetical protein